MKMILTLFMLAVFAFFLLAENAEAILNLDAETFQASLEEEAVSLAPNAVVLEVKAVTVSNVLKWPREDSLLPPAVLDVTSLTGIENSSAEGRTERTGILLGGGSRL